MSERDHQKLLAGYNLPHTVNGQALKLLNWTAQAETIVECLRAADRAEGFVLGLDTIKALNAASIEVLYLAFEHAAIPWWLELDLDLDFSPAGASLHFIRLQVVSLSPKKL